MSRLFAIGITSAFITRIQEQAFDPQLIATLQERLAAHGAQLQGQLPELLLRSNSPEEAIRSWLSDKDLSHWVPQSQGGSAEQGWQFETASWNRSRGAQAMAPAEIARAQADGGIDALLSPGVASDMAGHCLEAALWAAAIALVAQLLQRRQAWTGSRPSERKVLLKESLKAAGLSALSGAGLSLVVSMALALMPGGQILMTAAIISSATRVIPGKGKKAFSLLREEKNTKEQQKDG